MPRNPAFRRVRLVLASGLLVLVYGALLWQYGTPQPPHGGGPPVLLWTSLPTTIVTGVVFGTELARLAAIGGRFRTALLQVLAAVLLFTPVMVTVWLSEPGYLGLRIARNWHGVLLGLSVVMVGCVHLLDYAYSEVLPDPVGTT